MNKMTIKEKLDKLPTYMQDQLMLAFNAGLQQFVVIPDTKGKQFLGVNCEYAENLNVTETAGVWCSGNILNREREV
jgi:hypothetical protein